MANAAQNGFLTKNIKQVSGASLSQMRPTKPDLEKWLERLPLLDVGRTSQQLLVFLTDLSVADISHSTRLELLDTARKPVHSIINSLSKHYFTQKIQLSDLAERIFTLSIEFKCLQAQLYFYIAQQLSDSLQTFNAGLLGISKKKNLQNELALAIHRGITELSRIVYDYQMLYSTPPQKTWARLHYLLALAAKHDIDQHSVFDNTLQFSRKSTINQAYNRAVIMSLLSSGKVKQSEITTIDALSELWSDMVFIEHQPSENSLLMVNPYEDSPPTYLKGTTDAKGLQIHYINVVAIQNYLKSTRFLDPNSPQYTLEKTLSGTLISHLIELFTAPIERHDFRQEVNNATVDIVFGIPAIHYYLSGQVDFKSHSDLAFDTSIIPNSNLTESLDFSNPNQSKSQVKYDELYPVYRCDVHNISRGGIGLSWNKTLEIQGLKSGELVIYKQDGGSWDIGVVRWIRKKIDVSVEFGIQLLSNEITACTVAIQPKNQPNETLLRGLLLSDTERNLAPLSLITQGYSYKPNHRVNIKLAHKTLSIGLENSILDTGSFIQLLFSILSVQDGNVSETQLMNAVTDRQLANNTEDDAKQYDDIWHEI